MEATDPATNIPLCRHAPDSIVFAQYPCRGSFGLPGVEVAKWRNILAVAALVAAVHPLGLWAQQPWAIELGVLGRYAIYDDDVEIENAFGFGGRAGVLLFESISLEGEAYYAEPELTDQPGFQGRAFVSHFLYQGRLLYTHWMNDDVGLLAGAGYAYDNYSRARNVGARGGGLGGLIGLRYKFNDLVSGRLEGTGYFVSEGENTHVAPRPSTFNLGLQAGLSVILGEREVERIVELPAPPPDTIIVTREAAAPPMPQGYPTQICLATGENVTVYLTARGDTLVGPNRVSVSTLGPAVAFAGEYAAGRSWFQGDEAIQLDDREHVQSGGDIGLDCSRIMQVGQFDGVPLFADVGSMSPYERLYLPVRPGVWQAYQTDLAAVRA